MKVEVKIDDRIETIENVEENLRDGLLIGEIIEDGETHYEMEVFAIEKIDGEWEEVKFEDMELNKEYVWIGIDESVDELEEMSEEELKQSGYIKRIG